MIFHGWDLLVHLASIWLLNYLVHSTLLLGGVWLLTRLRPWSPSVREVLWKTALLGSLVTATVPTTGWGLGASWSVPVGSDMPVALPAGVAVLQSEGPAASSNLWERARTGAAHGWPLVLMGIWGMGAALCGARLLRARRRLFRRLGARRVIGDGPARHVLDHLCRSAGVTRKIRLTVSDRIGGPVALGRNEICLPERALRDLDREQLYHVLAHEMAHLLRGDPGWRWVLAAVEGVFFLQPLNRVARRRLHETAEFLCDDWTVERTGEGVTLARCLVEVAAWIRPFPRVPAANMASGGGSLVHRVERLLNGGTIRGRRGPMPVAVGIGLLAVVVTVAPGFVLHPHQPPETALFPDLLPAYRVSIPDTPEAPPPSRRSGNHWVHQAPRASADPGEGGTQMVFERRVHTLRLDPSVRIEVRRQARGEDRHETVHGHAPAVQTRPSEGTTEMLILMDLETQGYEIQLIPVDTLVRELREQQLQLEKARRELLKTLLRERVSRPRVHSI